MQTVSNGDSLHEMSNPVFWKKTRQKKKQEKYHQFASAELGQRVVKVNEGDYKFQVTIRLNYQMYAESWASWFLPGYAPGTG